MPERVVVVAREVATGTLLREPLQNGGYSVVMVSAPRDARELLGTQEVDAVVLAADLHDRHELHFCLELRETLGPWVVIVVVSPPGPASRYVVALELGMDDVMITPVVADELLARLAAHLRRRHRLSPT